MKSPFSISGTIVDVVKQRIFRGILEIENGKIKSAKETDKVEDQFIIPGLIDAHIHIESSMLVPSQFARMAVVHGTVATVSDPHEIANVLGMKGIGFMIGNGRQVPFKFYFGAPSCVPATGFESSGSSIGPAEIEDLLKRNDIKYMSEMMNFPGVLYHNDEVMAKLAIARKYHKPVDGHAPGLSGKEAQKYIEAGITTDHECFSLEEALDKIKLGMKIQIREGSAAKNFDTLIPLINSHPDKIMFCSDDKHPDDLVEGHINLLVKRAIQLGYDPLKVIRICTLNPVHHYKLEVGLLQQGDPADFAILDNFQDFNILATFINGNRVAENGQSLINSVGVQSMNNFKAVKIDNEAIQVHVGGEFIKVIKALDGQLITKKLIVRARVKDGKVVSDPENDICKIAVINRYSRSPVSVGFVNGFGFKKGAIASTVAHDSHNIIAVGISDNDLVNAINLLVQSEGGIALADSDFRLHLPLPVAGLMSDRDGYEVAKTYQSLNIAAKNLGSRLNSPKMTLSFMALLVIPELKISDKGLFDGIKFEFTFLFTN
ncbi:MAG: adenine deaminase [Bacteroidetes bacterium]|nr:adenine deaminase [Bacteroidota bacterium]